MHANHSFILMALDVPNQHHEKITRIKALSLQLHIPNLDVDATTEYLWKMSETEASKLRTGAFGSLAFDVVFSPGIIPKKKESAFKDAYRDFLKINYTGPFFDQDDQFIYQREEDYYFDKSQGPNHPLFLSEWVANLRAIKILHQHFRPMSDSVSVISGNLIEAALCRMAESGEQWPDNLFYALPINMQERLHAIRSQLDAQMRQGKVLAPGQFFRIANELEFQEAQFLRGSTQDRINMALYELEEHRAMQPAEPASGLVFDAAPGIRELSPRQFRQINLSSVLHNPEQAQSWTNLLLGIEKNRQ